MKVVVLGSTGLVGSAVVRACDTRGINCVALTRGDVDITNPQSLYGVIGQCNPAVVINATGIVGINPCEDDPLMAVVVNTMTVAHLVDICNHLGIFLVQPSTHNVFDGTKDGYYTELDIPKPIQTYGMTKYLAEKIMTNCKMGYVVRYPTLFGTRINGRNAFPDKVIDWIRCGKEFNISYDKIDSPSYSMDVANRTIDLFQHGYQCGVYHVTNSGSTNYYDFVQEVSKIIGIDAKVSKVEEKLFESKAPNALKTAMSSVKLLPLRTWQVALKDYLSGS